MYFKYNGINLYYKKYQSDKHDAKNIIILPGFGDTRMTFTNLIYHLNNNYNIYILDFPGFGKSSFPNYDMTIYDYTLLVDEWIKSLNITNPILIGHSFGGRIIITLCGYYKFKYDNIILLDSAGIKPKKNFIQKLKTFTYKLLMKIIKHKKLRKKIYNLFSSSDYKLIPNNMKQTFKNVIQEDLTCYLKNIRAKTLIIWGDKDLETPLKDGVKINKLIKNSELIILNNTNHYCYLGRENLMCAIIDKQLEN